MEVKRVKVIMLPTTQASDIFKYRLKPDNKVHIAYHPKAQHKYWEKDKDVNQHLYFTSNEEIKEGDWYMFMEDSLKGQFEKAKKVESQIPFHNCKKIIASTDKSLDLPKPSEAFIVKYCELGGIDEVDVEYINQVMGYCANCTGTEYVKCDCIDGKRIHNITPKLNVDNHNTITIHSIKDSWSREEVEDFGLWLGEYYKKIHISFLKTKPKTIDELFTEYNNL